MKKPMNIASTFVVVDRAFSVTPHGDETVRLSEPGAFVIVPRGTWHTAKVNVPTTMLFVTPGQGTENREQPIRDA